MIRILFECTFKLKIIVFNYLSQLLYLSVNLLCFPIMGLAIKWVKLPGKSEIADSSPSLTF